MVRIAASYRTVAKFAMTHCVLVVAVYIPKNVGMARALYILMFLCLTTRWAQAQCTT